MEMYKYNALLWQFNMMLDSGKYDGITIAEIKHKIESEELPAYLKTQWPDADFSMIQSEDWVHLLKEWNDYILVTDEARKMGVVNRGICLLLGYTINGYQTHPDNPRNKGKR